jgi:hypothetical protein
VAVQAVFVLGAGRNQLTADPVRIFAPDERSADDLAAGFLFLPVRTAISSVRIDRPLTTWLPASR